MKKIVTGILFMAIVFAMLYAFVCYAWIGAEYRIEGDVHFGKIDSIAAAFLCCIAVDYLFGSALRKRKDKSNEQNIHM